MNQIKVLIVEDDPMVVEITKEFIKEDPDYNVSGAARCGVEAVGLVEQNQPDLVLLDYCLPDFNGNEVIEKVRRFNKSTDFIVITAAKEVPLVQECFRLGIRDYLIKPYLKQRFLQALKNYQQFYTTLHKKNISQADLDKIAIVVDEEGPSRKGFSQMTENKILVVLNNQAGIGITAEELALKVGITPVSARRYLKLLQDKKIVAYELIYGKQGRPTYLFKLIP